MGGPWGAEPPGFIFYQIRLSIFREPLWSFAGSMICGHTIQSRVKEELRVQGATSNGLRSTNWGQGAKVEGLRSMGWGWEAEATKQLFLGKYKDSCPGGHFSHGSGSRRQGYVHKARAPKKQIICAPGASFSRSYCWSPLALRGRGPEAAFQWFSPWMRVLRCVLCVVCCV